MTTTEKFVRSLIDTAGERVARTHTESTRGAWALGYLDGLRLWLNDEGHGRFVIGGASLYTDVSQGAQAVNYLAGLQDGFDSASAAAEEEVDQLVAAIA